MKSVIKKQTKITSIKIISVLVVFFLLSTTVSTVIGRNTLEDEADDTRRPFQNLLKSLTSKDRFQNIKDKIINFINKFQDYKESLAPKRDENGDVVTPMSTLKMLSEGSSTLNFHTSYNGHVEDNRLKIFRKTNVDIDGLNGEDISVKYSIGLGIVAPLSLSINFKFEFEKLPGYESLADKYADFEAYTEIYFPGILFKDLENTRLRFGFESAPGEKIPEELTLTYKFMPNLLNLGKKMSHRFCIEPGDDVAGLYKMNMTTSFAEMDGETVVSEVKSKIAYSPVEDSEIKISGTKRLTERVSEYERIRAPGSDVDLYLSYFNESKSMVAYVADFPEHVKFTKSLSDDGYISFDTFGDPVSEIGIVDDFDNPVNKVYFSGLFSEANLTWNLDLYKSGIANVSVFTKGDGVSLNMHLEGGEGGQANFSVAPNSNLIDCKMELNTEEGYFRIYRNDFDVDVEFDVVVVNETQKELLSSLYGSFTVNKWYDGQFEILFEDLFDGNATVNLAGKTLEIVDLNITGYSPKLGGDFHVRMDKFVKELKGNVTIALLIEQDGDNITGNCSVSYKNGVKITNLSLLFGDFEFARDDIDTMLSSTKYYNFTIAVSFVEWYVAPDLSSGYIVIKGHSYIFFSFDSKYWNSTDVLVGKVKGSILLKTLGEEFNISWDTIDGNFTFNINGSGLAELSGFELWIKDKVDVSVPSIKGSFTINTFNKTGEFLLELAPSTYSFNLGAITLNISGLQNIALKGEIGLDVSGSAKGYLFLAWNESGLIRSDINFSLDATGTIEISDFEFKLGFTLLDLSIAFDVLRISGSLSVSMFKNETELLILAYGPLTDVNISGLKVYFGFQLIGVDLTDITFNGVGEFSFVTDGQDLLIIINASGDENSNVEIKNVWIDLITLVLTFQGIEIKGLLTITVNNINATDDVPLKIIVDPDEEDIYVDHINLGPTIIEIWGLSGGAGEGDFFGLSVGTGHSKNSPGGLMPVLHFDGYWHFEEIVLQSSPIVSDVVINGSLSIEFWFDPLGFSFFYLNGIAYENTSLLVSLLGIDAEIIFEPGKFNLMMQQTFTDSNSNSDFLCATIDTFNWVRIKVSGKEVIRVIGFADFGIEKVIDPDGKLNILVNAKDIDGNLIVADFFRIIGNVHNLTLGLSFYYSSENGVLSISDFDVKISGTFDAYMWIKLTEDTGWTPFTPFPSPITDGAVTLLVDELLISPRTYYNPNNSSKVDFQAWYFPPIDLLGGGSNTYIYNLSYGDGTYHEIITSETEVLFPSYYYSYGNFTPSITVKVQGSSDEVYDEFDIMVKPGGYCGMQNLNPNTMSSIYGKLVINKLELDENGSYPFQFKVINKANEENPYELDWSVWYQFGNQWDGENWTFEPENGTLNVGEEQIINVTAKPPYDLEDYTASPRALYYGVENLNLGDIADSTYISVSFFNGFLWNSPVDHLNIIDLTPGLPRTTGFLIKNVGWTYVNWSIDTASLSPNGTWDFSKTSGTIPPYSGAPIWFTVTANGESLNLDSIINITNDNDSSDYVTLPVYAKSKGPQQTLPDGVDVIADEETGDVTIRIGGNNSVEIDDLWFSINGIQSYLNGKFSINMGQNNWVYIKFNQEGEGPISINGSGEFLLENFKFMFGDNISINLSYLGGDFIFREGQSGNFSMEVNESSSDVNIAIDLDYGGTKFKLQGDLDVIITGSCNGTLWVDWNLSGDKPIIDIGGDLEREGNFTFSLLNLLVQLDGINITADELSATGSCMSIVLTGDGVDISSSVDIITIQNLIIDIDSEGKLEIYGVFDLSADMGFSLKINEAGTIDIDIIGDATLTISDFVFKLNDDQFVLSLDQFNVTAGTNITLDVDLAIGQLWLNISDPTMLEISNLDLDVNNGALQFSIVSVFIGGNGTLYIGKDIDLDASITFINVDSLSFSAPGKSIQLNGNMDLSLSGDFSIHTENQILEEFSMEVYGQISVLDFYLNINEGMVIASFDSLYVEGDGTVIFDKYIQIEGSIKTASLNKGYLVISDPATEFSISGQFNFNMPVANLLIEFDVALKYVEINAEGQGTLDISNFEINLTNFELYASIGSTQFLVDGSGYLRIEGNVITASVSGVLSVDVTDISFIYGQLICQIPSISLSLNLNADLLEINWQDGLRVDLEGAMGSFAIQNAYLLCNNEGVISQFGLDAIGFTLSGPNGYIKFVNNSLEINANGQLDFFISNLAVNLNDNQFSIDVPSLNFQLGLNVGKFVINFANQPSPGGEDGGSRDDGVDGIIGALGDDGSNSNPPPLEPPLEPGDGAFSLSGDVVITGAVPNAGITVDNDYLEIYGQGNGQFNIIGLNMILETQILDFSFACSNLNIDFDAGASFYQDYINESITLSALGGLTVSIADMFIDFEIPGIAGLSLTIPEFDVSLTAGVDELFFDLSSGPTIARVTPLESTIYVDDDLQLTAITNPSDTDIVWSSSDDSIATVSQSGIVTGVTSGTVNITATVDGGSQTAIVNVGSTAPTNLYIIPNSATFKVIGDELQLETREEQGSVSWSSSNNNVATVDNNGLVVITGTGTSVITADDGVSTPATSTVNVPSEEEVTRDIVLKGDFTLSGSGGLDIKIVEQFQLQNISFEFEAENVLLTVENIYLSVNETRSTVIHGGPGSTTTTQLIGLSITSCNLSSDLFIEYQDNVKFVASGEIDAYEFLMTSKNGILIGFDSLIISAGASFELLPKPEDKDEYLGIKLGLYGDLDVQNVFSDILLFDIIDSINVDASGDITFEKWTDLDSDKLFRIFSQNGISLDTLQISLDSGILFEIARKVSGSAEISSGFFKAEWNIDGDADGKIFLDSSLITLDNLEIIYESSLGQGWGTRLNFPDGYIDANLWILQWDPLIYIPPTFIPYNFQKTGSISGGIDIDITDGNYWYDLYSQ